MASLLPLLHDLLPMIMPSRVQISRAPDMLPVAERAERPPWYQPAQSGQRKAAKASSTLSKQAAADADEASSHSDPESTNFEPIRLLDCEEFSSIASVDQSVNSSVVNLQDLSGHPARQPHGPQVFRKDAMVGVTDNISATVLTVKPRSASAIHHHGEQDSIIYAASGNGVLLISPSLDAVKALKADFNRELPTREEEQPRRVELSVGDFAFVPAWTEHQILNEGTEGDVVWVVTRTGSDPVQVDLDGWGGRRIE